FVFFFSSRRRHTRSDRDWSSDVCSSDLTVGDLIREAVGKKADSGYFETEILQPLKVKGMLERDVSTLSGGELQRVAIALCLGRRSEERRVGKEWRSGWGP